MSLPVVTVAAGGLPVVQLAGAGGLPVTEAANGRGLAVTKVAARGLPVTFLDASGAVVPIIPPAPITWDPATAVAVTLSAGNLTATNTGTTSTNQGVRGADATGKSSGKIYFEFQRSTANLGNDLGVGIGTPASTYPGMGVNATTGVMVYISKHIWSNGADTGILISATNFSSGVWAAVAADLDNRKIWMRRGPSDIWNNSATANPATNTEGVAIPAGVMVPFCTFGGTSGTVSQTWMANFGATAFSGAVPAGFTAGWSG